VNTIYLRWHGVRQQDRNLKLRIQELREGRAVELELDGILGGVGVRVG
jgi:hypothetical protein